MSSDGERRRLFDALLEEVGDKGIEGTALDRALDRAGLEGNGFRSEFTDTDSALREAFAAAIGRLRQEVTTACRAQGGRWPQRVAAALQGVLCDLARDQGKAQALTAILPGADAEVRKQLRSFLEGLAPLMREGRDYAELGDQLPAEVEMLAVGAAEAIVCDEIDGGRAADLPAMGPQILFSLLVPFLGPEGAHAEMEAARESFDLARIEVG